ncbi:MAG: AbrB/MazE/SpoVT family DNA-binding domain-containing protein [Thermomicrobia bacterium]|nr:AbrB/MazE/SpoVT family DNA-binding domain-containing protein [Thermomicrobia bacterium]MCA1723222.1 AbrB/MazE/SpoVT family DNA-binding domain-containing protein [Thermomicrobia bacterium]
MIAQKLRRSGNSYIVTIPREEVERQGLTEGEMVVIEVRAAEIRPKLRPELRPLSEKSWQRHETAYRKLADK